jgi:phosphomannomutase
MKRLLLFDVDGTIAESGQKIETDMRDLLQGLTDRYDIGIVGGGKMDKILEQMGENNPFHHYFTECGCVYHSNGKLQYVKNLREHPLYKNINQLVKTCLSFLSTVTYTLSGHFIDLRNGIIYVSLIGMVATQEERSYFMKLDQEFGYRQLLLQKLKEHSEQLGVSDKITICEGGRVGIAIYPNEYDKVQVLDVLVGKYEEIHFFGDKYAEDGNDHHLIKDSRVIGHPVDSLEDTKEILKKFTTN